jgi:hypothetical protein
MRHPLAISGPAGAPQAPGPTPHSAVWRASGTTQPPAPQCWPARLRHDVCPGAKDQPPEARQAPQGRPPAREARWRSAAR